MPLLQRQSGCDCTGPGSRGTTPGIPGAEKWLVCRTGCPRTGLVAGPGLPAVTSGVCGPRSAARTSAPSGCPRRRWTGSRDPGRPVPSLRVATWAGPEFLWAALHPQPCVTPVGAMTSGSVMGSVRGQLWLILGVLCVGGDVGFPSPHFSPGCRFSPEFFQCVGSKVSNPRP